MKKIGRGFDGIVFQDNKNVQKYFILPNHDREKINKDIYYLQFLHRHDICPKLVSYGLVDIHDIPDIETTKNIPKNIGEKILNIEMTNVGKSLRDYAKKNPEFIRKMWPYIYIQYMTILNS